MHTIERKACPAIKNPRRPIFLLSVIVKVPVFIYIYLKYLPMEIIFACPVGYNYKYQKCCYVFSGHSAVSIYFP